MFGLEDRHLTFIKWYVKKTYSKANPDAKFYIFGSRAKGKNRPYSDIDIAIDYPELTLEQKLKLESDFVNSTFPYEVDIIDLNTINENFRNIIKDDLVELKINNQHAN